jgi:nitrite reductase/ring-hydroxylating ferredoxin subunit
MTWTDVMPATNLDASQKSVARVNGRQILVLRIADRIFACPNRCPHEGYPLSDGDCTTSGLLRCNWHNWTFDLVTGATIVGGDVLPQYPAKVENGRVLIELSESGTWARERAMAGLLAALDDADQGRLLRETIRLETAGGDRDDAVRSAIDWLAPRSQYGTTHAIGGAADWLALADAPTTARDRQFAALGEILGHIADDGRREARFPFTDAIVAWDPSTFLAAMEANDEAEAIARINGARQQGLLIADLVPTLAAAALSHYADFGHSLIYVLKTAQLARRLGKRVEGSLLNMLVRSLCYANREDSLPEFRAYREARSAWNANPATYTFENLPLLKNASVTAALRTVLAWSSHHDPEDIFRALVRSALFVLQHVDEASLSTTTGSIAKNATWLNFTHAITFADAGELATRMSPGLWPDVLLQLACFIGRSSGFIDVNFDDAPWRSADPEKCLAELREELFDHGRDRYIISVHLIKTLLAAERLVCDGFANSSVTAPALSRFFHSPMKGRHVLRTARQMLAVAARD